MSQVELYWGDAAHFDDWHKVDLVLTNAYEFEFIKHALVEDKPIAAHVVKDHRPYRRAGFQDGGALFPKQRPAGQRLWLFGLPLPNLSLEAFSATEEGWWPLDMALSLLRCYAKPDQTVIDGFMGRGTVGRACRALGLHFIGIDRDEDRVKLAEKYIFEEA